MKNEIIIFSDGASKGNPGPGGWGAVVVTGEKVTELGGHEKHTTNNRMELTGAIKAFENIAEKADTDISGTVTVYTDSRYVINGITKWISDWKRRDWKTLQKQDVVNRDLWEELDSLVSARNNAVKWNYVGGHIGIAGNERVDEIASEFAVGSVPKLFSGKLSVYVSAHGVDIKNISSNGVTSTAKTDSKNRTRAKAYSYVSMVKGVIKIHSTWAECEKRVKGVSATKFKKSLSASDEKAIIAGWKGVNLK